MNADRDKNSRERVRAILSESVSVLCRTMLQYDAELSIRGLLGITLDNREVFLVDILETVHGRNHDVSDVAVIDPGKEDSEGDMLVVDDSDIEDKQNRGGHQGQSLDKTIPSKCSSGSGASHADSRGSANQGAGHLISEDQTPRQTIGLKELGDAAFARSLNHIQQLASKSLLRSSLGMTTGLTRVGEAGPLDGTGHMSPQVLTTSTGSQVEPVTSDPNGDPNFRLQHSQQDRHMSPDKQGNNSREQQQQQQHQQQQQQQQEHQQTTMYALCACENTGDAADCAIKHTTSQSQAVWSHNEAGEYVPTTVSVASISSQSTPTPVSQVHPCSANPSTTVLTHQDPYQMWNKTNAQATTSTWQTLPPPTPVSSVPTTTTWPGPSQPQQQTIPSKNNTESMAAAAAAAPIQSLYSSLPETISSAILHTTYTQGNTPKNLRGEGVFPCKLCSRVFTYKKSKARHMKRHLGECFTCEVCKKTFCRKDVLARHQHNVHGVKMEVGSENEKSPSKAPTEDPPTISLLSQPNEVTVNSYPQSQTAGQQQRNFETVEFSSASTHLTVPRPPLAVVTSIPQPIQSFLTLNHSAIPTHQSTEPQPQPTLHHGASPQT